MTAFTCISVISGKRSESLAPLRPSIGFFSCMLSQRWMQTFDPTPSISAIFCISNAKLVLPLEGKNS